MRILRHHLTQIQRLAENILQPPQQLSVRETALAVVDEVAEHGARPFGAAGHAGEPGFAGDGVVHVVLG